MDMRTNFNTSLKEALKNKNQVELSTIRLIMAALKDRDIAARSQGNSEGIPENEILSMLQSMIKQRNESVKMYRDGGREELAEREEQEIKVIEKFLPQQLSDDEIAKIVEDTIAEHGAETLKDMGKVMNAIKTQYAGQVDMGKTGALVKGKLG